MRFDVDISGLEAGSTIGQAVCETVVGIKRKVDPVGYQFSLLQLSDYVGKLLWKAGKQWTVTTSDGEILILTHEQASKYNSTHFHNAIAKMRRCNRRLVAVDISQLPEDSRSVHDESIVKQSRILQAIKTKVTMDIEPVKRSIPLANK